MISKNYRYIISNTIEAFEEGQFQDFCRDVLPFWEDLYANFERHGATAEGKTRKGTPDFQKTLADRSQIGLQCSVFKDYWKKPKNEEKWKPRVDIDLCLEKLSQPSKIILCSNRMPPTNDPNIKSDLIKYAEVKTKVVIFTLADFENKLMELVDAKIAQPIFKSYFPELYDVLKLPTDFQKAYLEKICAEKDPLLTARDLKEVVEKSFEKFSSPEEREKYVLNQGERISLRYEVQPIPAKYDILRDIPKDFLLKDPLGKIITLVGVAKVGKTALVAQFADEWLKKKYNVRWFSCPIDQEQQSIFKSYFLRSVLSLLLPSSVASQLAVGLLGFDRFNFEDLELRQEGNFIYVIDNSELFEDSHLRYMLQLLKKIKGSKLETKIGFIFISNKSIKHLSAAISNEVVAPYFNQQELKEFIAKKFPENKNAIEKKYTDHLIALSSGHPLIAHAIVKKYPTFEELILATLKREKLIDEGLSQEAEELLFNDILDDNDLLNFVLRLSPLIFRARGKVLDAIMQIRPELGKSKTIIIDRLYGSVLEGDLQQGFSVASLYKKIADAKNSDEQRKKIYEICADILLIPKDKTLHVDDILEGALYAILAGQIEKALFWSTILLQNLNKKTIKAEIVHNILIQFEPILYIKPIENNIGGQSLRVTFLLAMAMNYMSIKDNQKALKIMKMIKPSKELNNLPGGEIFNVLNESVAVFEAFSIAEEKPEDSIKLLTNVDWKSFEVISSTHKTFDECLQILKELIKRTPIKNLPDKMFSKINNVINVKNEIHIKRLIDLGMLIGTKACQEKIDIINIDRVIDDGSLLSELCGQFARAQYILMEEKYGETNEHLKNILQSYKKSGVVLWPIFSLCYCMAGDMYFGLKNKQKAKKYYLKTLCHVENSLDNFDYGWANYRLGTLCDDPVEAERYFIAASKVFKHIQINYEHSIALGETAVALVQQGKHLNFMEICEEIVESFYDKQKQEYGTAATLILAHMTRLRSDLEGRALVPEENISFPAFERKVYFQASRELKPKASKKLAYYSVGETYASLKSSDKAIYFLNKSLNTESTDVLDKNTEYLALIRLLPFLTRTGTADELTNVFLKIILFKADGVLKNDEEAKRAHLFEAVNNFGNDKHCSDFRAQIIFEALNNADQHLQKLGAKPFDIKWFAIIRLLMFFLRDKFNSPITKLKSQLLKDAYYASIISECDEVVVQAGSNLGFFNVRDVKDIKELANIHLEVMKSLRSRWFNEGHIRMFGINLYKTWEGIEAVNLRGEYKKIYDLLCINAKKLEKEEIRDELSGAVMILLLASLNNSKGIVSEWAEKEIITAIETLPQDIKNLIKI